MTAAAKALEAARAKVAQNKLATVNAVASATRLRSEIKTAKAAATKRAHAEALGDALGDNAPVAAEPIADIGDLTARLAGYEEAAEILRRQLPAAEVAVAAAEQVLRAEQGRHVRQVIVPPLLAAAKEAGAVFGRAIAQLAAAQDAALHLQRRPGDGYVTGDAGTLMNAMATTTVVNSFVDAGAARTPLDWAGYADTANQIEDQLRELRP